MENKPFLLIHPNQYNVSRRYITFDSIDDCLYGICKYYEDHLKHIYPNEGHITYDTNQLFDYLDSLIEIKCMEYKEKKEAYVVRHRHWIKGKIRKLLVRDARAKRRERD